MMLSRRSLLLSLASAPLAAVGLSACNSCRSSSAQEVVVYTSVDQVFSEPVFRAFEAESGLRVRAVYDTEETKSTGVLNRLIAEAQNPQADVFWSGDPVRPFQLVRRDLVEPYVSPQAAGLPASARAADGTWTGFAARARVLLVNRARVPAGETPQSIRDLSNPRWRGQATIANPLFGTTTMHMGALFAVWGEERTRGFLQALRANDVRIASSNGEVKRLVVGGEVAVGHEGFRLRVTARSASRSSGLIAAAVTSLAALALRRLGRGQLGEQARAALAVDGVMAAAMTEPEQREPEQRDHPAEDEEKVAGQPHDLEPPVEIRGDELAPLAPTPLASFDPDTFQGWLLDPIIDELLASEPAIREGKSARTLIKSPGLTVVLTVLRAGRQLHEHKAPGSVLVVPLRGAVVFAHADQREDVATGGAQVLAMGPGLRHAVTAETDAAFLLVIGARA